MLDQQQILDIADAIIRDMGESALANVLFKLNQTDRLEEFIHSLGYSHLLPTNGLQDYSACDHYPNGKIIVVGASNVPKEVLLGVGKSLGITRDRFEMHLDYEDSVKYDFSKTQWNPSYALILAGPMPHSGSGKGDAGSVIANLEKTPGYPPVVRLGSNGLKITKSDFRSALQQALDSGRITV